MAARKRKRPRRRWLSHHRFMALEAMLLAALAEEILETWVLGSSLPQMGKLALVMGLIVGLFGVFFVIFHSTARAGISTAHGITKSLLVPRLLAHMLLLGAIAYLYARQFGLWPLWH